MSKVLALIVVCFSFSGCIIEVGEPYCIYDWECSYGYTCEPNLGACVQGPYASGTTVVGCSCAALPYDTFPGQTRHNNKCSSGFDVMRLCNGCCDAYCNFLPWGRVCL